MPYPALPDRRMPYDNDGTLGYRGDSVNGASTAVGDSARQGLQNDNVQTAIWSGPTAHNSWVFLFFPEPREVSAFMAVGAGLGQGSWTLGSSSVKGSNDTTNGMDGTWETASLPSGGFSNGFANAFVWRSNIKPISFTGAKKNVRFEAAFGADAGWHTLHLYGEAAGGAMAHDLIFVDPDLGAGVEFPAPEDFGDQPLGTTVVRPFRIKNTSASRTATNINIQCNDADFTIGESDSGPWVATINIASLAAGAESATMYIKCTTPDPGAPLRPRFARIIVVCDAGFHG